MSDRIGKANVSEDRTLIKPLWQKKFWAVIFRLSLDTRLRGYDGMVRGCDGMVRGRDGHPPAFASLRVPLTLREGGWARLIGGYAPLGSGVRRNDGWSKHRRVVWVACDSGS